MALLEAPPPVETSSEGLVYRSWVTQEAGVVVVHEETIFPQQRVPAEAYQDFRESCLAADAAQSGRLVFGPPVEEEAP